MVTTCCAYGCTYRYKKGDGIGTYRFPQNVNLRQLWIMAIRRAGWKPTPTSRICGKHFQTGKPSKNQNHPDYVPNLFIFNQSKNAMKEQRKIAQEKIFQKGKKNAKKQLITSDLPFCNSTSSENVKKKDIVEKRKATEVSSNNEKYLTQREITAPLQECVWLLNINSGDKDSMSPVAICEDSKPLNMSSSMVIKDDSTLSMQSFLTDSCDSTLMAESSIPAIEDGMPLNTDSSVAASKKPVVLNVAAAGTKNATKDILDNITIPTIKPVKETTDYDYSCFKSSPFDTKDILAIKLETMLAVNLALQGKVKFYLDRCKIYEKEINHLSCSIKKLKLMDSVMYHS